MPENRLLIEVKDLKEYFMINTGLLRSRPLKAVDGVSFSIQKGETLGLVGESGCGKTTVGRTILHLYKPTGGEIWYEGKQIRTKADIREFRKKATMVFQDPYSSLNPRMTVSDIIGEPLDVHKLCNSKAERQDRILELMDYVGLNSEHAARYAHEFSGGQRQRIAIARSLASQPKLVVLDEPTSSIDVFSQEQILGLIKELKKKFSLTNILISHDLGVVHELANKIAVMYLGKIVEFGNAEEIFRHPRHPYTRALFDAIPGLTTQGMEGLKTLEGQIPSPINPPPGCAFHERCTYACERCAVEMPEEREPDPGHMVRCLRVDELKEL